ncbi:non-homologous end-joining DNA ligase [Rhizobium sp. 2YAF20]|uniref:non-homologous end-joining DNA ligase n=1 Tax=Rhizobium sp. 2YAF20 TaxID=3233027 RepID=UPI003F98499B
MTKPPSKKPRPIGLSHDSDAPARSRPRTARDPQQPQLPFDPMPTRIEPCLALLKLTPPTGPEWAFEVKWDGYRLAVHIEPSGIRIISRGGHDWTNRFPAIAKAAKTLAVATAILDGEGVVLDDEGRSDFSALQQSLGGRGGNLSSNAAVFYAFDLLYFDGHDLTGMEQSARRHLLEDLLKDEAGVIRLSEEIEADGDVLFASACEHGLEGIIAKHRDRPYRSGRHGDWLKIKCVQSDSFIVVGYEPSIVNPAAVGSLLLAAQQGPDLVYVGSVGTGFTDAIAADLKRTLDRLKTKTPPVPVKGKSIVFSQPTLIVEIEYRAWTGDGKLRHPSYKGLREVQDNAAIYQIKDQ